MGRYLWGIESFANRRGGFQHLTVVQSYSANIHGYHSTPYHRWATMLVLVYDFHWPEIESCFERGRPILNDVGPSRIRKYVCIIRQYENKNVGTTGIFRRGYISPYRWISEIQLGQYGKEDEHTAGAIVYGPSSDSCWKLKQAKYLFVAPPQEVFQFKQHQPP